MIVYAFPLTIILILKCLVKLGTVDEHHHALDSPNKCNKTMIRLLLLEIAKQISKN